MATAAESKWVSSKPMCNPRVFMTAVVNDGIIYVIGGCNELGQPVNSLESYDTSKKEWASWKNMPTKRAAPIVAVINKRIVAIGGIGTEQQPLDVVEYYNIEENKWKRLSPLSEALMGMALVVKDNKIHIFGGMGLDTNPRDHFKCLEIDSAAGVKEKWQAFTPMPTARYSAQAFLKNNKSYVVGGRVGKLPVSSFEVYDYSTRSWTKYPELPTKRVFPSYVMTDRYLVSLGGLKQAPQQGFTDFCELYDTEQSDKGEWLSNKKMNMPTKRGDFTAVAIDNKVIVVGGLGNQGAPLTSTEVFDPESKKWKRLADMPRSHSTSAVAVVSGDLYVIGGISQQGPTGECEVFQRPSCDS